MANNPPHDCTQTGEPNTRHAKWHYNKGEKPCRPARLENAWARSGHRNTTLYGEALPPDYDCTQPVKPRSSHVQWHTDRGQTPCRASRLERSWARTGQYKTWLRGQDQPAHHDCTTPQQASRGHAVWHWKRQEPPCEASLIEHAWAQSGHSNTHVRAYTKPGDDQPRTLYQITFADGARYYGQTWRSLEARLDDHHRAPTRVGAKLRTGLPYHIEQLCEAPDRKTAIDLERLMIRSGNPHGELLNQTHVQRTTA